MSPDKDTNNPVPEDNSKEVEVDETVSEQTKEKVDAKKGKLIKFLLRHWSWLIIILLIITAFGIHYYNKRKLQHHIAESKAKEELLLAQTRSQLRENRFADVKNTVMVLSWAIRGEILRKNLDQAGQYIETIVKYKGFEDVIVANESDVIVLSTNKKFESMNLREYFLFNYVELTDIKIISDVSNPDHLFIIVPVMGMNSRIGTLMVSYMYIN